MAEKKEEAAVITLKAGEQLRSPDLVVDGNSVDLGNAVIAGDVRIDNRSGQPVALGREAREFFPKTEDGRLIIQDTHMTIVASAKEAQQLASSPIMERGTKGNTLINIILIVAFGTMTCFSGCGKGPGGSGGPGIEQPGNQGIDMSTKTITELREFLDDPLWENQRNAAVEIYARFERKVTEVTVFDVDLARKLLKVIDKINSLISQNPDVINSDAYTKLLELGAIVKDPLKKQLENENANIDTRKWSEQLLEEIIDDVLKQYDEILPSLRIVLKNPGSAIYDFAVGKVQDLIYRHPLALSTGIALLKDPVAGVRIAAANALADLGFESAIIPLGNARTLELDAKVIAALDNAINVLSQIADMTSWSLEDLKAALTSPYWSIQKTAIQLVLDKGTPQDQAVAVNTIQRMIAQLTSTDENTRNTSPYIHLLELGADAIAPLRANVENTAADIVTRQWSLDLLTQLLSYQDAFVLLEGIFKDPTHPLYPFAINSLTKLILDQTDPLALGLELLNSQVTGVRIAAIGALGQTGKIEAITPLKNIISTNTNSDEVTAAKNALGILYGKVDLTKVDLTTWDRTALIVELDNSAFWVIQKRAAQELFRRNDAEGIELARTKLVWPRINKMAFYLAQDTNSPYYVELAELGYIIIEPLLKEIQENSAGANNASQLVATLLGTMGEFNDVADVLASVTTANGYYWWQAGNAQMGLDLLFARQTPEFIITLLNDTGRLSNLRINAAKHLGIFKAVIAIADLENQLTLITDTNFIETIHTALSSILTGMAVGTYDEVFNRLLDNVLTHPQYSIYHDAIEELKKLILKQPNPFERALGLLTHTNVGVEAGAIKAFGEINDQRVFATLGTALSDPEKWVRFYAAEALGKQEKAAYLADLIALRERDQAPEVVLSAEKAIVRISIANGMVISLTNQQLMVGMQVDNLPTNLIAAQEIFIRGDTQRIMSIQEEYIWPWVNQMNTSHVPSQISQYGDISVPPLIDKASGKRWTNTDAVKWAARLLGSLGQFTDVFELLQHIVYWGNLHPANQIYDWWHAVEAGRGLAELYSRQSVESWMEILGSYEYKNEPNPYGYGRSHAAQQLGYKKDPRAIDLLMDKAVNDVVSVRYWAVWALGETGNTRALAFFEERLASGLEADSNVVIQMEAAISKIKANIAKMDVLVIDLGSQDKTVKLNALKKLGEGSDPYALASIEAVADSDIGIAYQKQRAIALITDGRDMGAWNEADLMKALSDNSWIVVKNALKEILSRPDIAGAIKTAAEEMISGKMNILTSHVFDTVNNNVSYRNLQSLGSVIDPLIIKHIHNQTVDYRSRRWMMILLGEVGEFNTAFPVLEEVLRNADGTYGEWARAMGIKGLTRLLKRQSTTLIVSYLSNNLDPVQIAAAKALGDRGDTAALPDLQAVAADTTESPEVINAVQTAIAQINAASSPVVASSPLTVRVEGKKVGGIDFNPALLNLQIKRDSHGVPLPLSQQPINSIHINGLIPIIINITPVPNLPMLLGLVDAKESEGLGYRQSLDPIGYQEKSKAREPEGFSRLN